MNVDAIDASPLLQHIEETFKGIDDLCGRTRDSIEGYAEDSRDTDLECCNDHDDLEIRQDKFQQNRSVLFEFFKILAVHVFTDFIIVQ